MNLCVVRKDNSIRMYGHNKNNHWEGGYDTNNWYYATSNEFKATEDSIIDICSGTHFTLFVT